MTNSNSDTVQTYTINQSTGDLTSVGTDATGSNPYGVAVDPSGRFAYVTNVGSSTVQTYTINQSTEDLTSVGTDATGSSPTFVAVDPTGRYVYVTNAGPETVQTFVINQSTGDLTSVKATQPAQILGLLPLIPPVDSSMWLITVIAPQGISNSTYNFSAGSGSFDGNVISTTSPTPCLTQARWYLKCSSTETNEWHQPGTAQTGAFEYDGLNCTSSPVRNHSGETVCISIRYDWCLSYVPLPWLHGSSPNANGMTLVYSTVKSRTNSAFWWCC